MPKPTLNVKKVSYFQIEYGDLDRFIQEVYNIPHFSCVSVEDWNNNSQHRIVIRKKELSKWEQEDLKNVKLGREPGYSLRAVMTDLCNQGLIEPGNYLICVCW